MAPWEWLNQWDTILSAVNKKEDLSDVVGEIKMELSRYDARGLQTNEGASDWKKENEYSSWEESEFRVDHQFIISHHGIEHFNGTLLHLAVLNGCAKVVDALIEAGANINAKDKTREECPLHFAIQQNHIDIVNILLTKGASTDAVTTTGSTPLSIATDCGRNHIKELLEKAKAHRSLNATQVEGECSNKRAIVFVGLAVSAIAAVLFATGVVAVELMSVIAAVVIIAAAPVITYSILKLMCAPSSGQLRGVVTIPTSSTSCLAANS
jgi:hypothetical protein